MQLEISHEYEIDELLVEVTFTVTGRGIPYRAATRIDPEEGGYFELDGYSIQWLHIFEGGDGGGEWLEIYDGEPYPHWKNLTDQLYKLLERDEEKWQEALAEEDNDRREFTESEHADQERERRMLRDNP
jgi:hypothetical protein